MSEQRCGTCRWFAVINKKYPGDGGRCTAKAPFWATQPPYVLRDNSGEGCTCYERKERDEPRCDADETGG